VQVEGREFICIDTGGIDGTEDGVETRMAEQSLLAIEEADVVLFMVDARAGLMPADEAIAKHLRSREKPTFLVANKTDGSIRSGGCDFWSLGLGEIPDCRLSWSWCVSLLEHVLLPWVDEIDPPEEWMKTLNTGRSSKTARVKTAKKKSRKTTSTRRICLSSWRLSASKRR
jgi:GTP-binding protein